MVKCFHFFKAAVDILSLLKFFCVQSMGNNPIYERVYSIQQMKVIQLFEVIMLILIQMLKANNLVQC